MCFKVNTRLHFPFSKWKACRRYPRTNCHWGLQRGKFFHTGVSVDWIALQKRCQQFKRCTHSFGGPLHRAVGDHSLALLHALFLLHSEIVTGCYHHRCRCVYGRSEGGQADVED